MRLDEQRPVDPFFRQKAVKYKNWIYLIPPGLDHDYIRQPDDRFRSLQLRGLDRWIERRIWSHRYKRWRNCGWQQLPKRKLYGEYGLVQLVKLIPSIAAEQPAPS